MNRNAIYGKGWTNPDLHDVNLISIEHDYETQEQIKDTCILRIMISFHPFKTIDHYGAPSDNTGPVPVAYA